MNEERLHLCPVRPHATARAVMPVQAGDDGWESPGDSHIVPSMMRDGGDEAQDVIDVDDDEVIQTAQSMPEPLVPSKAVVDAHNLSHWPYRSWCPHCVAARRPNSHHRRQGAPAERTVPLLCADYCFIRDNEDDQLATVLVCKFEPANLMLTTIVDEKGAAEDTVTRVAQFIKESGYTQLVYRSDQEPALRSLFEAAARQIGREVSQMAPEASSVGESQSNGRAEAAVRVFEDKIRTYKSALETRLKCRLPSDHPTLRWMAEHVCSVHNRLVCNRDGRTPFETIHGQRWRGRMVEFGEQVFYFVPKRLRAKLNLRWRLGTFLGNSQSTNEVYVAAANGDVVKTRSITRVVESSRWSSEAILGVRGTPTCFRPASTAEGDEHVEEFLDPHANADQEDDAGLQDQEKKKLFRKLRLTQNDFKRFGYTEGCRRCRELQAGIRHQDSSVRDHSDECRLRMYLAYKEHRHPKYEQIRHLIEDPQFREAEVDQEGAATTPAASPERLLFESGQPNAQSSDANMVGEDDQPPEDESAAMDLEDQGNTSEFYRVVNDDADMGRGDGEAWTIGEDGEFSVRVDPSAMVDALREAGVDATTAEENSRPNVWAEEVFQKGPFNV